MITRKISHKILGIDPSTIANIAFLLVALFLVMIVRPTETGLNTTLAPYVPYGCWSTMEPSNVFYIHINSSDKILVRNEEIEYTDIKDNLIQFVFNEGKYSKNHAYPQEILVFIDIDKGTSYAMYLNILNEIKAAYKSIWDTEAQKEYGRRFEQLNKTEQSKIFNMYPLTFTESGTVMPQN
jgi:biopolymer transport protein ExbD